MPKKKPDGTISRHCPQCGQFRSLKRKKIVFPHCEKQREVYERSLAEWERKSQPIIDAIRESQRITAKDLAIMVY